MRVSKDALAPVFDKISLLLDIGNHLEPPCISLYRLFDFHLNSTSILQRSAVAMVIRDWASDYPNSFSEWIKLVRGSQADFNLQKVTVAESLWLALSAPPTLYDELKYKMTEIDSVCRNYLTSLVKEGITSVRSLLSELTVFAADQAIEITSSTSKLIEPRLITPAIVEKRLCAHKNLLELNAHMETMTRRLGLWLAAAILETQYLPAKFNPLIKVG